LIKLGDKMGWTEKKGCPKLRKPGLSESLRVKEGVSE
jgi:hypothetical protein